MSVLSDNIQKRLWALNMSQETLAKKLGYKGRSSINRIVNGEAEVPFSKVEEIARILETTPSMLCGWDDEADDGSGGYNLQTLAKRLKKNEFDVEVFKTLDESISYIVRRCKGKSIGISDSLTLKKMKLFEKLHEIYGDRVNTGDERVNINKENMKKVISSEVFILSVSGISYKTGEMLNTVNVWYSSAAALCEAGEIIFVVTSNQITPDLEGAMQRARNVCAPAFTKKYGYRTPCAKTGKCEDCNSSDRYCRLTCIYYRKPKLAHVTVVLIDEDIAYADKEMPKK